MGRPKKDTQQVNNTTETVATTISAEEVASLPISKDLLAALIEQCSYKYTENGALALSSTFSSLLDLFGLIGALRYRPDDEIISTFLPAYNENKNLALKTLFYARDIRGDQGLGERNTFRVILRYLALNFPQDIENLIPFIPFYGRWDDLYVLFYTPLETTVFDLIATQLDKDLHALHTSKTSEISLLAKWLPSVNASSKQTRALASRLCKHLHTSQKQYRKFLSELRAALRVTETYMSAREWGKIDYPSVPSRAALIYRNAFARNDPDRYAEYLEALERGETKINAATLYPYDIVNTLINRWDYSNNYITKDAEKCKTAELLWKNLPNYLADFGAADQRYLVMADTSGSMFNNPHNPAISTSVGLAIYFAERTTGYFANHFLTFTDVPRLVEIPANLTLAAKLRTVLNHDYVGYSTNLDGAFKAVLDAAVKNHLPQSELPTSILVISDMEIDNAVDDYTEDGPNLTFTERWAHKFEQAGYKMPNIVYWNVEARQNTFHASKDDNVRFVSGKSAATFTTLCKTNGMTALETMLTVLLDERYEPIHTPK